LRLGEHGDAISAKEVVVELDANLARINQTHHHVKRTLSSFSMANSTRFLVNANRITWAQSKQKKWLRCPPKT